ncbi:GspH/FimT family pseudopilin [Stenotrophomonas sp.]|uniref:GspH/FimT family pseudopilin n=1 Tax=Stenotrophomonas sp. TaxID=69392 RepID=UPI00289F7111|nr:GspH/FimT family pseudopilin [Stenotrophomonas sp.]
MHRCRPRRAPAAGGWTLLEVGIATAVLLILLSVALPATQRLLDRQRAASARHLLSSHLAFARLAAIQRRVDISMCPSIDGVRCSGDAAGWGQGWIIRPTYADTAIGDAVLRHQRLHYPRGWEIHSSSGRPHIRYLPDGRAWGTNLQLRICSHGDLRGRVVVNNSGRIRSETLDESGGCTP